jgi:GH25 family lysozyme M1 (1,4-beta-N-acetylmuramidase)
LFEFGVFAERAREYSFSLSFPAALAKILGSEEVEAPIPPGRFLEAPLIRLHRMNIVSSTLGSLRFLMMAAAASAFFGAAPRFALAYLNGIDVYVSDNGPNNAQPVNWTTVKNNGYTFAFVKATDGVNTYDDAFTDNMTGANGVGIYVGPYHFARTGSLSPAGTRKFDDYTGGAFAYDSSNATNRDAWLDATSEAVDFIKRIRPYYQQTGTTHYLLPVSDIEQSAMPHPATQALKIEFVSNWAELFAQTVYDALGVRPMLYVSMSSANENFNATFAAKQPLWIAWYKSSGTAVPPTHADNPNYPLWSFWQWTDKGSVPGVHGSGTSGTDVDKDLFNGTINQLAAMTVKVVRGDYNHNATVDAGDYVTWRKTMSLPTAKYNAYSVAFLGADGNLSNKVDAGDYTYWRSQYGKTSSGSGSGSELDFGSVPEPCSIVILLSGGFVLLVARSRR